MNSRQRRSMKPSGHRQIIFDVSGLMEWYAYRPYVSGIQRVAERIITSRAVVMSSKTRFVARAGRFEGFSAIPSASIANLAQPARRAAAIGALGSAYYGLQRRAARD